MSPHAVGRRTSHEMYSVVDQTGCWSKARGLSTLGRFIIPQKPALCWLACPALPPALKAGNSLAISVPSPSALVPAVSRYRIWEVSGDLCSRLSYRHKRPFPNDMRHWNRAPSDAFLGGRSQPPCGTGTRRPLVTSVSSDACLITAPSAGFSFYSSHCRTDHRILHFRCEGLGSSE